MASATVLYPGKRKWITSVGEDPGSETPALHQSWKHVLLAERKEMNEAGKDPGTDL